MTQQPIKSKEEAAEVEAINFCYKGVWSMESPPGKIAADDSDKTRYSSFKRGFLAGWDAASKQVGEENRRLREALEGLVEAVPEQTNDADWWPDELTKAFGVALAALASVSDAGNKEETKK